MKIEVITKPYEVTDAAGIKTENLYMSKVTVTEDDKSSYETILAYHLNTKNYILLKANADHSNLNESFSFTENRKDEIVEDFLKINGQEVTVGKSSTNWLHIKL